MKEQLRDLSQVLQYLSFETMESMLMSMQFDTLSASLSPLNLEKLKGQFLMLASFHADEFEAKVDRLGEQLDHHLRDQIKQ